MRSDNWLNVLSKRPYEVDGSDLEAIADAETAKLETTFDKDALRVLIEAGGHAA